MGNDYCLLTWSIPIITPYDRFPSIYPDDKTLAETSSEFFVEKVGKISREFVDLETDLMADQVASTPPMFDEFVCLSSNEVKKLRKVKCSELDIPPTETFRSIWTDIVPYVTTLLNLSLTQATFPSKFKCLSSSHYWKMQLWTHACWHPMDQSQTLLLFPNWLKLLQNRGLWPTSQSINFFTVIRALVALVIV